MKRILITAADSEFALTLLKRMSSEDLENIQWIYGTYYDCYSRIEELLQNYPELKNKMILRRVDMSEEKEIEDFLNDLKKYEAVTDFIHLPAPKAVPLQFKKLEWKHFQNQMDISFKSAVLILMSILPKMAKEKKGKVILMSSYYATEEGTPNFLAPYVCAKTAMLGLMRSLAKEYGPKGLNINAVAPDIADTKFLDEMPDLIKEQAAFNNPKGRILTPDEVVDAFCRLLDESNTDNGKCIVVK